MGSILAVAALALLTAIAFFPWQTGRAALVGALLPVMGLHYWALRRSHVVPEIAVLFCGLTADIVSGGPLGFWTSLCASAWLIGLLQRPWAERGWKFGRWGFFSMTTGTVAFLAYVLVQIVHHPVGSAGDIVFAAMWLMLIYPVLAMLLRILDVDRQRGLCGVEGLQD